jgi:hypothetical protein
MLCNDLSSALASCGGGAGFWGDAVGGSGVEFGPTLMSPALVREAMRSAAPLTLGAAA